MASRVFTRGGALVHGRSGETTTQFRPLRRWGADDQSGCAYAAYGLREASVDPFGRPGGRKDARP